MKLDDIDKNMAIINIHHDDKNTLKYSMTNDIKSWNEQIWNAIKNKIKIHFEIGEVERFYINISLNHDKSKWIIDLIDSNESTLMNNNRWSKGKKYQSISNEKQRDNGKWKIENCELYLFIM